MMSKIGTNGAIYHLVTNKEKELPSLLEEGNPEKITQFINRECSGISQLEADDFSTILTAALENRALNGFLRDVNTYVQTKYPLTPSEE